MATNHHVPTNKWGELKLEIQKAWACLTDEDLAKTKGQIKKIGALIRQNYGATQVRAEQKLRSIFKNFESKSQRPTVHSALQKKQFRKHKQQTITK